MDKSLKQKLGQIISKSLDLDYYRVFIFGSRASGNQAQFSDIDVGIEGKAAVPAATLSQLEEDFEESDLPFQVEVIDFSKVSEKFKRIAKKKIISLN